MTRRTQLAALAVTAALAVAGCGGDDEDDSGEGGSETALTEEEFTTQANQICADGNQEIAQAGQQLGQNPSQEQVEAFVNDTLIPTIEGQLAAIDDLVPPESIAGDVDAVIADAQAVVDRLQDDPSLVADQSLFAEVDTQLTELGLTDCVG
jgi:hypothetical protein